MLTSRILFFVLLLSVTQISSSLTNGIKILSYDVHAAIRSSASTADIAVTCEMMKDDTTSRVEFLLNSNVKIQSIRCRMKSGWSEIPFHFIGKDTLQLHLLPKTLLMKALTLQFVYKFPIDPLGDSLLMLDRGNRWYPLIPDQIATLALSGDVPKEYTLVTAGNLVTVTKTHDRSRFVWKSTTPLFKLPLLVFKSNSFKLTTIKVEAKKILLYSLFDDSIKATQILTEAGNVFTFCRDLFGEYPFNQLTLIEIQSFEGINISSSVLMIGSSFLREMKQGNFDGLQLTISQQWIGAGVFAKFGKPGFWFLSLSLPHYLRLMYVRQTLGENACNESMMQPLERYKEFSGTGKDIPILSVDFPNTKEKGVVLYAKGPLVISKIHKQLGDEQWRHFLRALYQNYQGKVITYDDFRNSLSNYDKDGTTITMLDKLMTEKGLPKE